MRLVKLLSSGQIIRVDNNEAHALIDSGKAELYYSTKPLEAAAGVNDSLGLRHSGGRAKGQYLTKEK